MFKKLERIQLQAVSMGKFLLDPKTGEPTEEMLLEVTGRIIRVQKTPRGSHVLFMQKTDGSPFKLWSNRSIDESILDPLTGNLLPTVGRKLIKITVADMIPMEGGGEYAECEVEISDEPFKVIPKTADASKKKK